MKLEDIDEFKPIGTNIMYTAMEYVANDWDGNEVLFVGTVCGQIHTFLLYRRKFPRNLRPEILSRDSQHSGSVTCILYSNNNEISTSQCGIVISGSSDRTIKIWSPMSSKPVCIQTLYGHEGTITQIVDGHDGTILSCSVDGTLRLWKPQRGRKLMLHHFLECTYVMKQKNSWLSSLAVSPINVWACYVGNMDGTIEIYHKGADNNEAERRAASFTGQLTKFKRWDHVHTLGIHLLQIIYEESFLLTLSFDHTCKILDLHLGTTLHTITNSHNCKYMGIVWDSSNFQMFLSDENGYLEVWSSFYERKIEDICMINWKPPKRETNSLVNGNITSMTTAQLYSMPLVSNISRIKSSSDCIIALHPRTGIVTLWQTTSEASSVEFHGHNDNIILGLSVLEVPEDIYPTDESYSQQQQQHQQHYSHNHNHNQSSHHSNNHNHPRNHRRLTNATIYNSQTRSTCGISPEESTFFSVGGDNTVICWDEYDRSERFSFRLKESGEVVVMRTIWSLHFIATGHEDGIFCLWNIDSAAKVSSRSLRGNPITDIAEGKNKHNDDIIIASDRTGRIAVWNLSLFRMHCIDLPLELLCNGFHHMDDPGILSLSFHKKTSCFFSGGADGIINCWRLLVDNEPVELDHHNGNSVWNLEITSKYLVSGDESGEVVLWLLENIPIRNETRYLTTSRFPLQISKLCCWKGAIQGSFQSLCLQQWKQQAYISIADHTGKSTSIWCVKSPSTSHPSSTVTTSSNYNSAQNNELKLSQNEEKTENIPTKNVIISPKIISQFNDIIVKEYISFCEIYWNQERNVTPPYELQLLEIISHDNLEVSCQELRIVLNSQETTLININNMNNNNSNNSNGSNYGNDNKYIVLYLGMSNGIIQKHKLKLVNL